MKAGRGGSSLSPRARAMVCLVSLSVCASGCGNSDGGPSSPSPSPSPNGQRINGNERIGWDQRAGSAAELANLGYVLYVDGNRVELSGVECAPAPGASGFPCAVRLPPLEAGRHELSLAAYALDSGAESARSSAIEVIVGSSVLTSLSTEAREGGRAAPASGRNAIPRSLVVTTRDGVRLRAATVATGLNDPVDVVATGGSVLFVAERGGTIRVVRNGVVSAAPAARLDDVAAGAGGGLLSIAADPAFDENGRLFALYTARSGFRLARFRAVGDTLGDRAILIDGIESGAQAAASIRFGPDAKLYVALDDGGVPAQSGDFGSFNGKVLRLNADATTPRDQPGGSPVHVTDIRSPRGVAWRGGALWVVEDGRPMGSDWLRAVNGGRTLSRYRLPAGTRPAGLAIHHGAGVPAFTGDLLVAARDGRALLRLKTDPAVEGRVIRVERLLHDAIGPIQAVAVEPSGAVLLCTDTAVVRLAP